MMLEKLNYNQKCYLLFIGLCLFFVVGYKLSFSDTFVLADQIKENQKKLDWLIEKEKELPALKLKMSEFEKAYQGNGDSLSVRDKLTAFISEYADAHEGCMVTEIPQNSVYSGRNMRVHTNVYTIKGTYAQLLTLLFELEQNYQYVAKVMSARFYSLVDNQLKKKSLFLTIVTQSFAQENHEKK